MNNIDIFFFFVDIALIEILCYFYRGCNDLFLKEIFIRDEGVRYELRIFLYIFLEILVNFGRCFLKFYCNSRENYCYL